MTLPAREVGQLSQDRDGVVRWAPDESWERGAQEPRLGLDFLRRPGPRSDANHLPRWFENLLPERGTQLRERLAAIHGLREGQSFELLRAVGSDLAGAVEVRGVSDSTELVHHSVTETPEERGAEGETASMSALTGVQMKFTMSMVNDKLVLFARGAGKRWIVKVAGRDFEDLAAVEGATMSWAKAAGLAVPEHMVMPFERLEGIPSGWIEGREPVFVIQRFDRREDGSKIHQEDLCQALDLRPTNKYGDGDIRVTFEGALRLVFDACGEDDAREMARRIGFMVACGNGDAHLKNWSLVWGDRLRPTLSPCYDLVSTICWERLGWAQRRGPKLALSLGGQHLFKRIDDAALDAFASKTWAWAKEEALSGIGRAFAAWQEVVDKAPMRMRSALGKHWQAVPVLARWLSVKA